MRGEPQLLDWKTAKYGAASSSWVCARRFATGPKLDTMPWASGRMPFAARLMPVAKTRLVTAVPWKFEPVLDP